MSNEPTNYDTEHDVEFLRAQASLALARQAGSTKRKLKKECGFMLKLSTTEILDFMGRLDTVYDFVDEDDQDKVVGVLVRSTKALTTDRPKSAIAR